MWVEDVNEQKCVKSCPDGAKYHEKSGKCVSSCTKKADADGLCVDGGEGGNKAWLIPTIVVPVSLATCAVGVVVGVACERRRKTSVRNSQKSQKKPTLKQLSPAGSRASSRSSVKNGMLEARTLGSLEDASLTDKKPAQNSAKIEKKHVRTVPKTLKVRVKPAKETPLLGEEEMPEQRTENTSTKADAQKKLKNLDELLWDNVLGEGKRVPSAHLQEMGKGAGLTPMKVGEGRQQEE